MNILELIQNVRSLIAAVRANDWRTALTLLMAILDAVVPANTPNIRMAASPAKASLLASCEAKSSDDLLSDLDACCDQHEQATDAGAFIDDIKPLLIALGKRLMAWLLGFGG